MSDPLDLTRFLYELDPLPGEVEPEEDEEDEPTMCGPDEPDPSDDELEGIRRISRRFEAYVMPHAICL